MLVEFLLVLFIFSSIFMSLSRSYQRISVKSYNICKFIRFSTFISSSISKRQFDGYKAVSEPKKDAYINAKELDMKLPCIILVNPFLDQNVGSVARVMLNFGLTELRVVDPKCDIKSENAIALAAGASEVLISASIFGTLKECVADLNRVMATTIRPRDMNQMIYSPSAGAKVALEERDVKVGIMFGRERNGLSNEEIAVADSIITIPSYPQFSSLNLAQAVNIVSYEIWCQYLQRKGSKPPEEWLQPKLGGSTMASREDIDNFLSRLEKGLDEKGYQTDPRRRELAYINIRNIFQRTKMTTHETDILHGVLTKLLKQE